MLAVRSLCMSVASAVFVLKRAHWLFAHNVANAAALGAAFLTASILDLDLHPFLWVTVAMLMFEYGLFALALAWKSHSDARTAAQAHP